MGDELVLDGAAQCGAQHVAGVFAGARGKCFMTAFPDSAAATFLDWP